MIENLTPFAAEAIPDYSIEGRAQQLVVVKATLDFAGRPVAQGQELPIHRGDVIEPMEPFGDVARFESDVVAVKPAIDVIVNAFAYAPGGKPSPQFTAGLRIGKDMRAIHVFGERIWRRRLNMIPGISAATAVMRVPVIYQLAFGGADRDQPWSYWEANPIGTGYSEGWPQAGLALPQIEWPDQSLCMPGDRAAPAAFGCIGRAWQPRKGFLGIYADGELPTRGLASKMPRSFDPRAWNCANPRLQFPLGSITAGTPVELYNLSRHGSVSLVIPAVDLAIGITARGIEQTVHPAFDTLTIEPELEHFALTWRHVIDGDS